MPPASALVIAALAALTAAAEPGGASPEPGPAPDPEAVPEDSGDAQDDAADPAVAPPLLPGPFPGTAATPDAPAPRRAPRPRGVAPPRASRPTVEGSLLGVDHREHRLTLRTAAGEVTLSFDRNTFVFAPGGAASLVGLAPGEAVRAGHDGAHRATWVELKGSTPPSTPARAP
jgi:hypothetical protein